MRKQTSAGTAWLFKMAWRDGKASVRKLMLFMASIVLGVAALVAIQSFGKNLEDNISQQSQAMMGADFIIDSHYPPNEKVQGIIDSLGGSEAREINFASMISFPEGGTKLVRVRGVEGPFPLYGTLETEPASAAISYQEKGMALVDATVMTQFELQIGDSIKVGEVKLPIGGRLISVPGRSAVSSTLAPPVFIPYSFLEKSGLVQTGSRLEYQYFFLAGPDTDLEILDKEIDPILDAEGADLDTHSSTSQRTGNNFQNFGKFLNLVAFIALLLGCVGIASSVDIYIKEKLSSVAVLHCVGATRRQTFSIYLIQVAGMGLIGALIGTAVGVGLQYLLPVLVKEFLPVDVSISLAWQPIFMGILLGVIMSVLFALIPLLGIAGVSPLQALRISDQVQRSSRKTRLLVFGAILLFIFLFSLWILRDWAYSLAFAGGLLVAFLALAGVSILLMRAVKRYFPHSWGFVARQSLLNLFRPQNQTLTLVLAIGMGTFLISTLYFTRNFLIQEASLGDSSQAANMILFDVQSGQKEDVAQMLRDSNLPVKDDIPIVSMRVQRLKDREISELRKDTTSEIHRWILNHEFRATYRDSLIASEQILSGDWIGNNPAEAELIPISVSENFAEDALVEVGDEIVFDVQGVRMTTMVSSIREVDWRRLQLNFSVLFPAGVLEEAPQFHVLTTRAENSQTSAAIQQKLVKAFPNVSIFDLRQMLRLAEDLLNRIALIISIMAFFSILTGIIVLIGAVRTSKYQRIRESVLLRTLGAKNNQIRKITALEYLYLGLLGSIAGLLLSVLSSALLAWFAFDAVFAPSVLPFLLLPPGISLLVVVIGLSNSSGVIKSPPLEVLRKEA